MLNEQSPGKKVGKDIDPREAAESLAEWADKNAEALKGINGVEAVREARESR
jgi:hypothetical protein